MPVTIDYLPVAIGGAANVESQAAFAGDSAVLANGFTAGTALSAKINKILRQSSMGTAALATFIGNVLNANVLDDGNLAGLVTQLTSAITTIATGSVATPGYFSADSGSANAGVVTLSPVPANYAALAGKVITVLKDSSDNSGAYTLNANALGAQPVVLNGAALQAGMLPASCMFQVVWNNVATRFELISDVAALPANFVSNAMAAQAPANTLKGNLTGGTANVGDNTRAAVLTWLGFASSIGAATYFMLPGGAIMQLGYVYVGSNFEGNYPLAFATSFPTACLGVVPGTYLPSANNGMDMWAQVDESSISTTGVSLYLQWTGVTHTGTVSKMSYIAWGY